MRQLDPLRNRVEKLVSPWPAGAPYKTEHKDGAATLTHERLTVCFESVWELEALAMALPGLVPTDAHTNTHYLVRAIAGRIKQLTSVQMPGLGDSMEKTSDLQCMLLVTHMVATA